MPSEYQRKAWAQWGQRRDQGKMTRHWFYHTWRNMNRRCGYLPDYSPDGYNDDYRDIDVFPSWRAPDGFPAFAKWITVNLGPRPDAHTLDRIDPFGDYVPDNLRWASRKVQATNTRWSWFLWALEVLLLGHEMCQRDCLCDWTDRQTCTCDWARLHPLATDDHQDCSEPQLADVLAGSDTPCPRHRPGACDRCPLKAGCEMFDLG